MIYLSRRKALASPADESGQSITELAVLAPVLILILLGALDLGRVYDAYVTITNASREGARYGASNPTCYVQSNCPTSSTIQNRTTQEATNSGVTPLTVSVDCAPSGTNAFSQAYCASPNVGDQIRVTVTYTFQFITTELFGVGSFTMSNYTIMAITNGACPLGQAC